MSYTPTTWAAGDTVTAAKLNKLENGVANAGGVLIVNVTFTDEAATVDKTWQEIHDAVVAGKVLAFYNTTPDGYAQTYSSWTSIEDDYSISLRNTVNDSVDWFGAESATGYPVHNFN